MRFIKTRVNIRSRILKFITICFGGRGASEDEWFVNYKFAHLLEIFAAHRTAENSTNVYRGWVSNSRSMIDSNIFHVINKRDIYIAALTKTVRRGRDISNDRKIYDRIKFTYSLYNEPEIHLNRFAGISSDQLVADGSVSSGLERLNVATSQPSFYSPRIPVTLEPCKPCNFNLPLGNAHVFIF